MKGSTLVFMIARRAIQSARRVDGLPFAATVTLAVGLWAACQDAGVSPHEVDSTPADLTASLRTPQESLDRQLGGLELRFKEIENSVPGFAGFYIDVQTGDLVMRLTDVGRKAQLQPFAEEEADKRLTSDGGRRSIRYETANYSFSQLRGFRGAMFPHLDRDDVVFVDIDEVENRLSIGVTSAVAREELLSLGIKSGIPADGIHVGTTVQNSVDRAPASLLIPSGDLSDHQDTIVGGVVVLVDGAVETVACSAWIGATIDQGTEVFATASHCDSVSLFQLDTNVIYGHDTSWHDAAKEWKDPAPKTCNDDPDCEYRWADIALYEVLPDSSDKFSQGWFAQTTNQSGSTTFHSTEPVLRIEGEVSVPTVGDTVHRVGYKTGWRKGPVVRTGVDQPNWDGSGVWLFDQDEVAMTADDGDSGSPIVIKVSNDWKIIGIHVGSRPDTSLLSAMWNIEEDLGGLATLGWPMLQ